MQLQMLLLLFLFLLWLQFLIKKVKLSIKINISFESFKLSTITLKSTQLQTLVSGGGPHLWHAAQLPAIPMKQQATSPYKKES